MQVYIGKLTEDLGGGRVIVTLQIVTEAVEDPAARDREVLLSVGSAGAEGKIAPSRGAVKTKMVVIA
ncbi:hypothetical protein DES43_12932 [Aquamicrobium defluvii]|uniref:Uncharacterized protein n=1 Tax=Aquamicrobium defluvii TaxID=69279 RepID=A0A4R6Y9I0_9HYPH|nr:hypothetical protein DES43_12932 [Aquamicrobium defluvii]